MRCRSRRKPDLTRLCEEGPDRWGSIARWASGGSCTSLRCAALSAGFSRGAVQAFPGDRCRHSRYRAPRPRITAQTSAAIATGNPTVPTHAHATASAHRFGRPAQRVAPHQGAQPSGRALRREEGAAEQPHRKQHEVHHPVEPLRGVHPPRRRQTQAGHRDRRQRDRHRRQQQTRGRHLAHQRRRQQHQPRLRRRDQTPAQRLGAHHAPPRRRAHQHALEEPLAPILDQAHRREDRTEHDHERRDPRQQEQRARRAARHPSQRLREPAREEPPQQQGRADPRNHAARLAQEPHDFPRRQRSQCASAHAASSCASSPSNRPVTLVNTSPSVGGPTSKGSPALMS